MSQSGSVIPPIDEADFDESGYLAVNPDVAAAVSARLFESGWHHFSVCGRAEGRSHTVPRSRRDKLLGGLDLSRLRGLEIGPLMTPLVTKAEGDIRYVDHVDTAALHEKYRDHPGGHDLSLIVPVDHVWGEQTLSECIGGARLDYVLNSHVIEHVPDVVTWLQEIHSVLKPGGSLRMAIPDRRYTFDLLRAESTLADALDAYIRRPRRPLPRAILDHFLHYTDVSAFDVWDQRVEASTLKPTHTAAEALRIAELSYASGRYQDTHCWVFTPMSFAKLGAALAELGRLSFVCEHIYPTAHYELEFVAVLRSTANQMECVQSWTTMVRQLEQ